MKVTVLGLGHRIERDKRLTTHCALVSRAFGAGGMVYTGQKDSSLERSVEKVVRKWGGPFSIRHAKNWRSSLKGRSVHLTIYGIPLEQRIKELSGCKELTVIVGGEKVPSEVYHTADFNISVTSQPHSEIAALSILLDRLFGGRELSAKFRNAELEVVPQERGKKVIVKG